MLNVDALSKTLSAMPLPQLQQYASIHKNDPYVVSLALSIANQKKEMQTAQQGMAGQQQMPKVAEQAIAGMSPHASMGHPNMQHALPEEQGIGALAAPNMEHLAEGGIIGSDAQEQSPGMFDFVHDNEPVVRMAGGGMVSFADGGMSYAPYGFGNTGTQQTQLSPEEFAEAKRLREMGMFDLLKEKFGPAWQALTTGPAPQVTRQTLIPNGAPDQSAAETARLAAQATPATQSGAQNQGQGQNQGNNPPPVVPAPTGPAMPSMNSAIAQYQKYVSPAEKAPDKDAFMAEREAVTSAAYDSIAKKLADSGERMKSDKQESAYMAMIKGGLAMAAGASPFGLTNIAKGLESGAADYSDALKEFRKAAAEQEKMEIELTRAKAAEKRGDMDAYQKAMEKVGDRNAQRDDRQAAGIQAIVVQDMHNKSQAAIAGQAPSEIRTLKALQADPKLMDMYQKMNETKGISANRIAASKEWAASPTLQMQYPNPEDYYKIVAGSSASAAPSTNKTGWGQVKLVSP